MKHDREVAVASETIQVQAREILRIQKRMEEIYAYHTGKSEADIRRDLARDFWMGAQETVDYGIVDTIVGIPVDPSAPSNNGTNGTARS